MVGAIGPPTFGEYKKSLLENSGLNLSRLAIYNLLQRVLWRYSDIEKEESVVAQKISSQMIWAWSDFWAQPWDPWIVRPGRGAAGPSARTIAPPAPGLLDMVTRSIVLFQKRFLRWNFRRTFLGNFRKFFGFLFFCIKFKKRHSTFELVGK